MVGVSHRELPGGVPAGGVSHNKPPGGVLGVGVGLTESGGKCAHINVTHTHTHTHTHTVRPDKQTIFGF